MFLLCSKKIRQRRAVWTQLDIWTVHTDEPDFRFVKNNFHINPYTTVLPDSFNACFSGITCNEMVLQKSDISEA